MSDADDQMGGHGGETGRAPGDGAAPDQDGQGQAGPDDRDGEAGQEDAHGATAPH
ncbi:MAG TPA: hypothetical protein VFN61_06415 [Acidimicrobiales bacterium]|nr:hypothetical protein [Acidimicrobiales bacterium]